jgi:hypothetical protein
MDITSEGCEVSDVLNVLLTIQDSLIEVRDAPTERDVVVEELAEFCCCLAGVGVTPGTERSKDISSSDAGAQRVDLPLGPKAI